MNIFYLINTVTQRIEPFHSEFLAEALKEHAVFLEKFLELVLPSEFLKEFGKKPEISSEFSFSDGSRIDILIQCETSKQIVGIEVKTSNSSVTDNQLLKYHNNLHKKHTDYNIFMVFLTPYSKTNLPKDLPPSKIKAIQEFSEFNKISRSAMHVNWLDIIEIYGNCGLLSNALFSQHYHFIKDKISNPDLLRKQLVNIERNRSFSEFIGEDTFNQFYDCISDKKLSVEETDSKIIFFLDKNISKYQGLIKSILVLINSNNLDKNISRNNEISAGVIDSYEKGEYSDFFVPLLEAIKSYPYIWLKGKGNIGVRGLYNSKNTSGVSLFTLLNDRIEIRKTR